MQPSHLVRQAIESLPSDAIFTATDLRHCGKRAAIDQVLARLARNGVLLRVARGFYTRNWRGSPYRDPKKLKAALARKCGAEPELTPEAAAQELGLTKKQAVPEVWVTDGSRRRIRTEDGEIILKPRALRASLGRGTQAGKVVLALRAIGPEKMSAQAIAKLRRSLDAETRQELRALAHEAPAWMEKWLEALYGE